MVVCIDWYTRSHLARKRGALRPQWCHAMSHDGADFSPSRSRSPAAGGAASAVSQCSDEESRSPTWREQREDSA
eukprot:9158017-Alexandrium_andersonii.AAC.1